MPARIWRSHQFDLRGDSPRTDLEEPSFDQRVLEDSMLSSGCEDAFDGSGSSKERQESNGSQIAPLLHPPVYNADRRVVAMSQSTKSVPRLQISCCDTRQADSTVTASDATRLATHEAAHKEAAVATAKMPPATAVAAPVDAEQIVRAARQLSNPDRAPCRFLDAIPWVLSLLLGAREIQRPTRHVVKSRAASVQWWRRPCSTLWSTATKAIDGVIMHPEQLEQIEVVMLERMLIETWDSASALIMGMSASVSGSFVNQLSQLVGGISIGVLVLQLLLAWHYWRTHSALVHLSRRVVANTRLRMDKDLRG